MQFLPPPDAELSDVLVGWSEAGDASALAETQMLLRELLIRVCSETKASGVMREAVWMACDPRHFFRLPVVIRRKEWRYHSHGRVRSLVMDVTLNTMDEIKSVLGAWGVALAWRTPAPSPTKRGLKRERRLGEPEYFMITDGAHDGKGALAPLLSYCIESCTMTLRVPIARFDATREWIGGSQLPPRPPGQHFSLISGAWVAAAPTKDEVDAHVAIEYGA